MNATPEIELSSPIRFRNVKWTDVPNEPGVYVITDEDEVVYVGMAGRNGKGSIRNRLRDDASGQIVNMFAQYLFLAFDLKLSVVLSNCTPPVFDLFSSRFGVEKLLFVLFLIGFFAFINVQQLHIYAAFFFSGNWSFCRPSSPHSCVVVA